MKLFTITVLLAVAVAAANAKAAIGESREDDATSEEFVGDETTSENTETTTEGTESPVDPTDPPATEDPERPPQEGDPCEHEVCRNTGYCQAYLRCDKESGRLVKEECGENLVWNPLNPNGTDQVHGGNCDVWENLDPAVERKYRSDEDCLACFWRERGECERSYDYQPVNQRHRNVLQLSCAEGLVFSKAKETCQRCEDVKRADGSSCCGGEEPEPTTTES